MAEQQLHGVDVLLQVLVEVWQHYPDQLPKVTLEIKRFIFYLDEIKFLDKADY